MNGQDSKAEIFDVFLCHNSEDKPAVREIARKLVKEGIKPWLDEDQIQPGTSWQTALGQQIKNIKSAAVFAGDGGLGPWQNQEIQAFLNQFVGRECPVIPVILPLAKAMPELPWTLANLHRVDFRTDSHPMKRLMWGITGQKPEELSDVLASDSPATMQEAANPRLIESRHGQAPEEKVPALIAPPDPDNVTQLNILRRRVAEYWANGVLKHSLYDEVLISLGKRQIDKAVDAPWKYTVEVSDAISSGALADRDVSAIYDATGLLLILGEPGSGKTTTLLDLTRTLLERAGKDIKERVPVVLNLSSWKKKLSLTEWMLGELSEKYRVPRKIARLWLQNNYLLPLLDGLDEVETTLQPDCVTAINAFIEEFNPSGLLVCCRLNEYRWLPKRLKLNGAICIEPLSSKEVSNYLVRGGSKLAALRGAVDTDPVLQELAQTPLMLSIMSLAFQGAGGNELARQKGNSEERRKQIFRLYVEQMFQRKGTTSLVFPKVKIIGWLSWLAGKMRDHSQSVFLVEGLQPSWLGTRAKRVVYGTVVALSLGLIFGLTNGLTFGLTNGLTDVLTILVGVGLGCWWESPLKNGVMSGWIVGLIGGLIEPSDGSLTGRLSVGMIDGLVGGLIGGLGVGSLNHITLVETISWKWNQFWKRTIPGSIGGLISGLIVGLIGVLIVTLTSRLKLNDALIRGLIGGLIIGLPLGLVLGLVGGLVSGLVGGFTDRVKASKVSPNQGIKLSLKNSLAAFLVTWLTFGLIFGLILGLIVLAVWLNLPPTVGLTNGLTVGLKRALILGLTTGLTFGLIVGLNRGGSAVIKHYALRLTLWRKGYTPFKFVKFLDHCARLILLKKVGGGYIFIHRMLLDYFADLSTIEKSAESKRT